MHSIGFVLKANGETDDGQIEDESRQNLESTTDQKPLAPRMEPRP